MGGLLSTLTWLLGWSGGPSLSTTPDPATGLSERDRYIIRESWALVGDKKNRRANGIEFFIQLFRAHPYMLKYFPDFQDKTEEQLRKAPKLKAHALSVMFSLGSLVEVLDNPEDLVGLVGKLAESHYHRHIYKSHFEDLGEMFIPFLVSLLGTQVSEQVKESWTKLLGALVMVIGMKQDEMAKQDTSQREEEEKESG